MESMKNVFSRLHKKAGKNIFRSVALILCLMYLKLELNNYNFPATYLYNNSNVFESCHYTYAGGGIYWRDCEIFGCTRTSTSTWKENDNLHLVSYDYESPLNFWLRERLIQKVKIFKLYDNDSISTKLFKLVMFNKSVCPYWIKMQIYLPILGECILFTFLFLIFIEIALVYYLITNYLCRNKFRKEMVINPSDM